MSIHLSVESLKSIYLFSRLNEQDLERIYQSSFIRTLQAGEQLFQQGEAATAFFWLQSGSVKIYRLSPEGDEKVFHVFGAGRTFAEALMFQDQPIYHVSAQALQESHILQVDSAVYREMLHHSVDSCFQVMAEMSARMQSWLTEIDSLTLKNANYRLAYFLQHHINHQNEDSATIYLDMPKHVLASRLSVKPETLSRLLKQLQKNGVLEVDKRSVTITDMEKFHLLLDDD